MTKISSFTADTHNANKGTVRGNELVERSLRKYGAGRSILIDRNGKIIAGNKTAANASAAGLDDVIVVQTDGTQLVAVQRTDIDLDSAKGRELAIADNRTAELGLEWDPAILGELSGDLDLKPFFTDAELAEALGHETTPTDPNAEWVGMPQYGAEDQTGVHSIIVHFKSEHDVQEFARAVGQTVTPKTKYIWFPEERNADLASRKYVSE